MRASPLLLLLTLSAAQAIHAQATRTWVSGIGDDANPCSLTAPCKTWAGAISKTATGGEIDALTPGGFGALTIAKSITVDGGSGQIASTLVAGTNGFVVNAPANSVVTVRNVTFQGLAPTGSGGLNGILFSAGSVLHIEHCVFAGFTQNGINVNVSAGVEVFIDDTTSQDNTGNGLNIVSSAAGSSNQARVSISNSHFSNNAVGVLAGDNSRVSVRTSDANGNTTAGFEAMANSNAATMSLVDSVAALNAGAGVLAGGGAAAATIRASRVAVFTNTLGFQAASNGAILSFGDNVNPGAGAPTSTVPYQ